MAGIKISALPSVPSAQLTDVFPMVQGGTTYKETNQQLLSLFQSSGAALTEVNDTNITMTLGGSPSTALLNATSLTMGWAGLLGIARGGTSVSSVTTTPTASAFSAWDLNKNFSANNFIPGFIRVVTSSGNTTLTVASPYMTEFTGSLGQTCIMPLVSTLALGTQFLLINDSTGSILVTSSSGDTIEVMQPSTTLLLSSNAVSGVAATDWNVINYTTSGGYLAGAVLLSPVGNQTITSGNLTVSTGNLVAGSSGHAGIVTSYPATATVGNLSLTAVASSANYAGVISNASLGQSTTWSLPDPGASTSTVAVNTGSLTSGHLASYNGTSGLLQDSGIASSAVATTSTAVLVSSLGTGVQTALEVNTNSTGGFPVETDGTFTPVLNVGGSPTGITYGDQAGAYSRIGNIVTISLLLIVNSPGSNSGNLSISGLPYPARSLFSGGYQTFSTYVDECTLTGSPQSYIFSATSIINLFQCTSGISSNITNTSISSGSAFIITGSYLI
jgi:hypothetical protein